MANRTKDLGFDVVRALPPLPGSPAAEPMLRFPAEMIPPPGAQYFTIQGERDSAAIENVVFAEGFAIPNGYLAVINTVQFFASNADATLAGSSFQLLAKGIAVPGFEAIQIPQLGGAQGAVFSPAYVRIGGGGGRVGARWINVLGGAHHVGFLVQGWIWTP